MATIRATAGRIIPARKFPSWCCAEARHARSAPAGALRTSPPPWASFSPQERSGRPAKHSSTLRRVTHVPSFIERKRDGLELSGEEIAAFIRGFTSGAIPDYQASAWAMAVYFRGMTRAETHHLTRAMMESGRVLAHPAGSPPKVDKHSTGGIAANV